MRYKKGEMRIQPQDLRLLATIVRCRFSTRPQLIAITAPDSCHWSYANGVHSRLRRLAKAGYILENHRPHLEPFFTISPRGLTTLLEQDMEFAHQVSGIRLRPANPDSRFVQHELALNDLWPAFKRDEHFVHWTCSFDIDIASRKGRPLSYKRYDARVLLETPKGPRGIAIEYERVLKSKRYYHEAIRDIQRDNCPLVIYATASRALQNIIGSVFRGVTNVIVCMHDWLRSGPCYPLYERQRADGTLVMEDWKEILARL